MAVTSIEARLRWVVAALALAVGLLSPSPIFGNVSGGHALFQMERKAAFVSLFKNIRVPKSTEEYVIRFAVPDGVTTVGHNTSLWWNTVIDVRPFRDIWNLGKFLQRTDADEHVVNNNRCFPVVVNASKIAIGGAPISKASIDITPLHLPPVFAIGGD